MTEPWERLKDLENNYIETPKVYRIFTEYLNLKEGRSLKKLEKKLIKDKKIKASLRQLENYSSLYDWYNRSKEFDDYQLEKAQHEIGDIYLKDMKSSYGIANKIKMGVAKAVDELENDEKTYAHLKLRGLNDGSSAFANADKTQREIANINERSKNTNVDVSMDADIRAKSLITNDKSAFDKIEEVDKILDELNVSGNGESESDNTS